MTLTQITEKGIKDGEIVNADINASAAIAKSKLASLDIVNADVNASAAIAKSKLASLDIVNADVNASAAIAGSKIDPTFTSTVNVTNNLPEIFLTDSNSNSARARINANGGGLLLGADNDNAHANSSISFEVDGSNTMVIKDDGKVGIGTTNPTKKLYVVSSDYQTARFESTADDANGSYIEINANSSSPANNDILGVLAFRGNNSASENLSYAHIRGIATDVTDGAEDGDILFHTRNNGTFAERVRIDSSGNVGIGTSSPSQKFTLKGLASFEATNSTNGWVLYTHTDNTFRVNYNGAGNDEVIINSDGRVGIGSTVTGCNLTVAGKGLAITGQNFNHSANSLRLGEEGSGKAQIRCYGTDNSTFGSLEVLLSAADGSGTLGDITFERASNGANIKFPAGGGLDFSSTDDSSSGTSTSKLLNDYEEGTWTPAYFSTGGTYGYHTQIGKYRKVGNVVTVIAYIRTSSVSATSHNLVKVSGLPFTEGGSLRTPGSVRCNGFQGTLTNMEYPSGWSVEAGQTFGELQRFTDGGFTDFTTSTMNNATFVYLQCTYITA